MVVKWYEENKISLGIVTCTFITGTELQWRSENDIKVSLKA